VNRITCYLPLLFCIPLAYGQSSVDVNVGFGTVHDTASTTGSDSNTGASCTTGTTCLKTPSLSGFFMGFGGSIMFNKHLGFGGEATIQPAKQNYSTVYDSTGTAYPLESRQIFYDVNAIYAPVNEKKVMVRLEGGIGGARTSFSVTSSSCVGTAVCQNQTQPFGTASHFQVHAGAGVDLFVTEHLFIRPQFDLHYVPNFTNQYGSTVAPGAMVWVGYSLGDK
jgi:Outer membrane protein beta-barrel domain